MKTLLHLFLKFISHITSDVKLAGNTSCSGRLEILHDQTWMSVCDAVFDQQDAEVVCRELDCGAPVQVLGAAAFDKETLRCGHKRFSAEEMNLRFTSVQHLHCTITIVLVIITRGYCVLVRIIII